MGDVQCMTVFGVIKVCNILMYRVIEIDFN
jgi:hypothetical protein